MALITLAACAPPAVQAPTATTFRAHHPASTGIPSPAIPSPTIIPLRTKSEATICISAEPESLYLYEAPEAGRDHLLAAIYDGPIDTHDYGYQPVLLTKLPSLADGDAVIDIVTVAHSEPVVDSAGRVVTLTAGVELMLADGTTFTYEGTGPASLPQMTVTFHLRPDAVWSDGTPLTAGDSIFSFDVGRSPNSHNPLRAVTERTAAYRAPDTATVEWRGLPGYLDPLYFARFWTPLPSHRYGKLTPAEIRANAEANRQPLGWGPFVLREWLKGERLIFERNPNYFRRAEGLPRLSRLIYRLVPPAAIPAALLSGECDVVPHDSLSLADAHLLSPAQARGELHLWRTGSPILEQLTFGIAPAADYASSPAGGLFAVREARQAVAHCIDRQPLAQGAAQAAENASFVPPAHPAYNPATPAYAFDPAHGRRLLAALGWRDSDGDGILDKGDMPARVTLAADSRLERSATLIQTQLQENCGLAVDLRLLTFGELADDWPEGIVFGRHFDLALFAWQIDSVAVCELFTSAQIASAANPGGANAAGYANAEFDRACRQAWQETRAALQTQAIFGRDLPALPLFFHGRTAVTRPEVAGFALDPTAPSELWNIETLMVEP